MAEARQAVKYTFLKVDATALSWPMQEREAAVREFADLVGGVVSRPRCTLDEGVTVMRCVEAIRLSHARRAVQSLTGQVVAR